jgi:hypothetical protein
MGQQRPVLHTLEHLAALAGGPRWRKELLAALGAPGAERPGVRVARLGPKG